MLCHSNRGVRNSSCCRAGSLCRDTDLRHAKAIEGWRGAAGVEGMTRRSREVWFLGTKHVSGSEQGVLSSATYRYHCQTTFHFATWLRTSLHGLCGRDGTPAQGETKAAAAVREFMCMIEQLVAVGCDYIAECQRMNICSSRLRFRLTTHKTRASIRHTPLVAGLRPQRSDSRNPITVFQGRNSAKSKHTRVSTM